MTVTGIHGADRADNKRTGTAPQRGLFVAFEGGDGAGKSTQVGELTRALEARGFTVLRTREPGGTPLGDQVRSLILDDRYGDMSARTEALLFAASRAAHVSQMISPALDRGEVVISDRYIDSSVAYQGVGRSLGAAEVRDLNGWATSGLQPDLTVLIDVNPEMGRRRRTAGNATEDRIESEADEFHARIRAAFLSQAALRPDKYLVLQAELPINDLADRVLGRVLPLLESAPAAAPAPHGPSRIVGVTGVAHAGKDTAGAYLIDSHGYTRYSLAVPMKEHAYLLDVRVNGTLTLSMLLEQLDYDWVKAENHRVYGPEIKRTMAAYRDKLVHDVFGHLDRSVEELRDDLLTLDPFLDGDVSMRTLLDSLGGDWELAKYHRFHGPEVRRHLQVYAKEVCRDNFGQDIWVQLLARKIADEHPAAVVITDVRFNEEAAWITSNGGMILEVARPGYGPANGHISEAGIDRKYIADTIHNNGTIDDLADALDDVLKLTPAVLAAA
jgi:dTMP kinase